MTTKASRSLPPNVLAIARIQRLLTEFPLETQRTILEFTLRSLEEAHMMAQMAGSTEPLAPAKAAE